MTSNQLRIMVPTLGLLVPLLMVLTAPFRSVYLSVPSLLFLIGASGVLQTFFSNQGFPVAVFRRLRQPAEKVDFHSVCASAALFAGCIPGIVLALALYRHVDEPSVLGPILAVILVTLFYGLVVYLVHFGCVVTQPAGEIDLTREASWLREHHFQLRRVVLITGGIVGCSVAVILMSFVRPDDGSGGAYFHDGQHLELALQAAGDIMVVLYHYSYVPWWIVLAGCFYACIRWCRGRLGFGGLNNPWIKSNVALVFGPICAIFILIYQLRNAQSPYSFVLPVAPFSLLVASWCLAMWFSRDVRREERPQFQLQTSFDASRLWTRVFQLGCFATILWSFSLGGFDALAESFLTIGFLCLFGIFSLSRQRNLERLVNQRTQELELANERNESLLHNVLPVSIAERLKEAEEDVIADDHHQVSILFADIAGFTAMSSEMSSGQLVKLLSSVFARFDTLAEQHQVEKIKTIGDAYMVASGVPAERRDHAHALAAFALDMRRELKTISAELGRPLDIRIGMHSGPVTAGVIGTQKFAYDLWGDTVNTASRMESNGQVGAIQISEETKALLDGAFVIEKRGKVTMKGKGELMTYFLLGTRE